MNWLFWFFQLFRKFGKHRHDYEMVFEDPDPLSFKLRCSCGDETRDMDTALRRMELL